MNQSTLLFDEPPIAFSPTLARCLGLHEAILLQQIHYWLQHKLRDPARYHDYFIQNKYWVKWNMQEMMERVPLGKSADPYKRTIKALREQSILLVEQHWKSRYINTNFYSIHYQNLESRVELELLRPIGGDATEREEEFPTNDELIPPTSTEVITTDLISKNSSGIEDSNNPPPLDTSDLPSSIRKAAAELAHKTQRPQDYIDLLTARLRRNRDLPVEQQIQQPLAWLSKVIKNKKEPDFSPALKIQEERRAAKELASRANKTEVQETREIDIQAAFAKINQESLETREAWINKHIEKLLFSSVKEQIKGAILAGKKPTTRRAGIMLIQFLNIAMSESK